jgi:MarR family transcriptional regulator, transcriptional regulator for hemolysin
MSLPIDSPERRRLPILLRRAWYGLNQAFRRRIAHTKATPDQFTVLRTLSEHEQNGLTQTELTKLMASDPNTVASLVERIEKLGWIERKAHEQDRRANRLRLKPQGKRKYLEIREIAIGLQTDILRGLPENSREEFLAELATVAQACQKAAESSPKIRKAELPTPPAKKDR